jgi:hypothetical protein
MGRNKATERLKGSLIGPDGKQTIVMATLTEYASKHLRASIGRPIKRFRFDQAQTIAVLCSLTRWG